MFLILGLSGGELFLIAVLVAAILGLVFVPVLFVLGVKLLKKPSNSKTI